MLTPLRALDALQSVEVHGRELLVASLADAVDQRHRGHASLLRAEVLVELEELASIVAARLARASVRSFSSAVRRASSSEAAPSTSSTRSRRVADRSLAARSRTSTSSRTSIRPRSSSSRSLLRFFRLSTSCRIESSSRAFATEPS